MVTRSQSLLLGVMENNVMRALEENEVDLREDGCLWLGDQHFSGQLLVRDKRGHLTAEESYFRGILHGPFREFDSEGKVILIGTYFGGGYHGIIRGLDTEGEIRTETEFEHGIKVAMRDIKDGIVVDVWCLSPDDPDYSFLESVRFRYAWKGWDEWKAAFQKTS